MIYISSSCYKSKSIRDSIVWLANNGFKNIELSGGTEFYEGLENDLLELKVKYNLNYICHNYFPPPKEHFVLNLASLNDDTYNKTLAHLTKTIELSNRLGAKKFGFHAGFFVDIKTNEIGKKISKNIVFNKKQAIERFCHGFNELWLLANGLELYIENNVFSLDNSKTYNNENIFMLTTCDEYSALKKSLNFRLLLDVAHLKVTSNTLGLDFETQLSLLICQSDYVHLSDNDGLHDVNYGIKQDSDLARLLQKQDLKNKDFTLEIYDNMQELERAYDMVQEMIND